MEHWFNGFLWTIMVNFGKGMSKLTLDLKYFWTLDIFFCDLLDINTTIFWTFWIISKN